MAGRLQSASDAQIRYMEYGAYRYELAVGERMGISRQYRVWAQGRARDHLSGGDLYQMRRGNNSFLRPWR